MIVVDILPYLEGLAYVGFIAGAIFTVLELRDMKKDRQLGVYLQAGAHITTREFEDVLCKIWKADPNDVRALERQASYTELSMVADYMEILAGLTERGLMDKRVWANWPFDVVWEKLGPWIIAQREADGVPTYWSSLERLAHLQTKLGRDLATGRRP